MDGACGSGEDHAFRIGEESGGRGNFRGGAFKSDICDRCGGVGGSGGGFGEMLPLVGSGRVATIGDVGYCGPKGDDVDLIDAGVRGSFQREIETEVATIRIMLVNFDSDDILTGNKSRGREVVAGVVRFT